MSSGETLRRLGFEAQLALRYLAGARGQGTFSVLTVLAVLGNLVGVAALVVGQAVMSGIETQAQAFLVDRDPHLWVLPRRQDAAPTSRSAGADLGLSSEDLALLGLSEDRVAAAPPPSLLTFDEALVRDLETLDALASVRPVLELDVFLTLSGQISLKTLRGVSLAELQARGASFRPLPTPEDLGLIVPTALVFAGHLQLGQRVNLITTQLEPTPVGRLPLTQEFQIVAAYPAPATAPLLTTLATTQFLFDQSGKANTLEIKVVDPFNVRGPQAALDDLLSQTQPVRVESWTQRRDSAVAFLGIMRLVLLLVLGLIILVSAFNIFAGQLMLTDAQRRSIAVMRSFGASQGTVLRIFLAAGAFIGLFGAGLGLILGLLVALNFPLLIDLGVPGLSFFAQSPPLVRPGDLIFAFTLAVALALIAAILPARSAARTPPVEALTHG